VLDEVYVMASDADYVELLRKVGFELKPHVPVDVPIMASIYGDEIRGAWRVAGRDVVASYPPLGYYDNFRDKIFVLDSVSDRLGLLVHENVHHAIRKINIDGLNDIEEVVARLYEVLAEMGVKDRSCR